MFTCYKLLGNLSDCLKGISANVPEDHAPGSSGPIHMIINLEQTILTWIRLLKEEEPGAIEKIEKMLPDVKERIYKIHCQAKTMRR